MKTLLTLIALFTLLTPTPSEATYQTFAIGTMNHQGLIEIGSELFYVETPQEHLYLVGEDILVSIVYEWSEKDRCSIIVNMKIIGVI